MIETFNFKNIIKLLILKRFVLTYFDSASIIKVTQLTCTFDPGGHTYIDDLKFQLSNTN